ncbi:P83/100 family protein [Spirochaeta isovalerica]|uniref:FtsZ-interacting cell division protein ZipA n=1 Tax=Spirochaeta isovalerica TaxID=150 RepID=A0A841R8K1_9SPIO|nr:P83/100 family protein [Spirochaeta isovalerica]MBB6479058.1 FtsZ-interacting cell division protein ZipA [Spirochaeta isovalerica]
MKKPALLIILTLIFTVSLTAIDVDRDEVQSYGDKKIEFYNYVGPYKFINTLEEILGLGTQLGVQVDPDSFGNFTIGNKYSVIHSVQPEIPEGFDGDIFFVGRDGAVDHIRNLRYIIASYLQSAYSYDFDDAFLLAEFITYYNAAYYQNLPYYQGVYKEGVVKYLTPEKAGLSTHYSEWAGKSAIVIPLSERRSTETGKAIDTGEITSEDVIEVMREEKDDAIDTRKDMVDLREEEIAQEEKAIEQEQEQLAEEKQQVDEAIEDIKTADDGTEKETLTPEEEKQVAELEEQKEQIEEQETQLEEEKAALEEEKDEVVKMREDIADDANKQIDEEEAAQSVFTSRDPGVGTEVIMLKIENTGDGVPYGRLIKVDIDNYVVTEESELNSIRGRTLTLLGGKLFAVAGMENGPGAVKLVEIDMTTLEIANESPVTVFPDTLLWESKNNFFAVISEGNDLKLGLFDATLTLKATSAVSVEPYMSPLIQGSSIYVQTSDGGIVELSAETLETLNQIK